MKKLLIFVLLISAVQLSAQSYTNRYSMKLNAEPDGTYSLINEKRYAAILDLEKIDDLLVPYVYKNDKVKTADYKGCPTREAVYKTYPDYELKLTVDMAKSESPAPFMIYIHGGGWARGTNDANRTLSQYAAMNGGVAGVRISYTLAPQSGATINVSIQDVKDAVKYIQEHAAEFNIDPSRFGFCGGSAGGHLAAVGAMSIPGARVMVGYAGIYDLQKAAITVRAKDEERVQYFLDKDPEVLSKASPVNMIPSKNIPAVMLIHGTGDITVECDQSKIFAEALKKRGVKNLVLNIYPNYDHNISAKASDLMEKCLLDSYDFIVKNIFGDEK